MGNQANRGLRRTAAGTRKDRVERSTRVIGYVPTPTGLRFHNSRALVKGAMGPVGSGKSVFCCEDIWIKSCTQVPMAQIDPAWGMRVRYSKWLVIRNTYWDLQQTTIKTWLDWFPQTKMRESQPLGGVLEFEHPSNERLRAEGREDECTAVRIELVFLALNKEEQVRHLKSLEVSGVWINEASEVPLKYVSRAFERTGRFPSKKAGGPFKNLGMIMDTNPPSDTGWWYQLAEVRRPQGYEFFRQPPAVLRREKGGRIWYEPNKGQDPGIPAAENVENHNEGWEYYMRQTRDGDHARIKVFLMGEYGTTVSGKAVYPQYSDEANYLDETPEPWWGLPLFMGTDFGRTPATVLLQVLPSGKIVVLDEICGEDMTIGEFCEQLLLPRLITKYRFAEGMRVMNFADPAGAKPNETDAQGAIYRMNELGIPTVPCPVTGNSPLLRIEAVASALRRRMDDGSAGLVLSRNCRRLREGFLGRYYYKTAANSDAADERVAAKPDKNMFSHPHDALQYGVFGATHQSGESMFDVSGRSNRLWVPDGFGGYRLSGPVPTAGGACGTEARISMAGFC